MNKITAVSAAVLMGVAGLATAAPAAQGQAVAKQERQTQRDRLPRDLQQLNLSDAQKQRIQTIMQEGRSQRAQPDEAGRNAWQQKVQAQRQAEQNLLKNQSFDEAAARRLIDERAQARAQMQQRGAEFELQRLKKQHAVFQVLTAKQQQQWLAQQDKRGQHPHHGNKEGKRGAPKQERSAAR